jgi:hypothetical protein
MIQWFCEGDNEREDQESDLGAACCTHAECSDKVTYPTGMNVKPWLITTSKKGTLRHQCSGWREDNDDSDVSILIEEDKIRDGEVFSDLIEC